MSDGSTLEFPLIEITGSKPGPALYLGGAIHGDEVNGVRIIGRIAQEIDSSRLRGSLFAVPIQNPLAFKTRSRYYPTELIQYENLYDVFPGNRDGTLVERMVHCLYANVISKCTNAIDLHTGGTGSDFLPYAFVPVASGGPYASRAQAMGKAFGTTYLFEEDGEHPRYLHYVATKNGIPCIGVEIGEGGRLEPWSVELGVRGVTNVMKFLGMLDGKPKLPPKQWYMNRHYIRAERSGVLEPLVKVGHQVRAGEALAKVIDSYGREVEQITAKVTGVVARVTTLGTINSGERVATIGERIRKA